MTVFEASKKVLDHFWQTINQTTVVQTSAIYAYGEDTILKFPDATTALNTAYSGFVFRCTFRDGTFDIESLN
jgi:hypothetical protein